MLQVGLKRRACSPEMDMNAPLTRGVGKLRLAGRIVACVLVRQLAGVNLLLLLWLLPSARPDSFVARDLHADVNRIYTALLPSEVFISTFTAAPSRR